MSGESIRELECATMDTTIRVTDKGCIIGLSLVNKTDRSLFLTTPLSKYFSGTWMPDQQKVYSFLDNSQLHITRRLWSVPDDIDVYSPELPYLTELKARDTYTDDIVIDFPVKIEYPYRSLELHGVASGNSIQVNNIIFSIGIVDAPIDTKKIQPFLGPQGEKIYAASYGEILNKQLLLTSPPMPITAYVLQEQ
jgi:hypothetical protein